MKRFSIFLIIDRLEKAQGILDQYEPFIHVEDFGSQGEAARLTGKTTGRIHHLLSKLEQAVFLILDYSEQVVDIREQFPLVPLSQTLDLAHRLGVRHPYLPKDSFPVIMTTDFLVTIVKDGHFETLAISVKSREDFDKPRTREKLNIEKLYWNQKGIKWVLVLDETINWDLVNNLKELDKLPPVDSLITEQMDCLEKVIQENSNRSLENIFLPGFGLRVFKYLILNHRLKVDLREKINLKEVFHESKRNLLFG